jgi:hypothetical protein
VQRALAGQACTLKDVPAPAPDGSRGPRRWFTLSFTTAYGDDGASAGVLACSCAGSCAGCKRASAATSC